MSSQLRMTMLMNHGPREFRRRQFSAQFYDVCQEICSSLIPIEFVRTHIYDKS